MNDWSRIFEVISCQGFLESGRGNTVVGSVVFSMVKCYAVHSAGLAWPWWENRGRSALTDMCTVYICTGQTKTYKTEERWIGERGKVEKDPEQSLRHFSIWINWEIVTTYFYRKCMKSVLKWWLNTCWVELE